jgi:hypothetical protein
MFGQEFSHGLACLFASGFVQPLNPARATKPKRGNPALRIPRCRYLVINGVIAFYELTSHNNPTEFRQRKYFAAATLNRACAGGHGVMGTELSILHIGVSIDSNLSKSLKIKLLYKLSGCRKAM